MNAEESPALAKVDDFAQQILSRLAPMTFGVARSPAELNAVYHLRCKVVMNQGWARPEDLPDGLERDDFDDRAVQIVAWDTGKLVGTTRLVEPAPGCRLPVEQAFDLQVGNRGVIDMGRTCRVPGQKDIGQRIFWGLLARSWIELRYRGFAEVCGIFSPGMMRLYQRLGFRVEVLCEARLHWGELRYPVLVRPAECVELLELD